MLQRLKEEPEEEEEEWDDDVDSDDDESEAGDLADRLAEVDLNNADAIWERLTDEEKQEFKSIVYNGEIEKIVKPIEPWWKLRLEEKLVRDIKQDEAKAVEILKKCPKIHSDIKDFNKMSTKKPAPCVIYNIANVIGAFTYVFRYYNGDHISYELEATDNLITICENLKANANFESIISVADSIALNCHNANLFSDNNTKQLMLEDLKDILDGPGDDAHRNSFILSALCDITKLLKSAKQKYRRAVPKNASEASGGTSKKFSAEFVSGDGRSDFKQLDNPTHFTGCIKKVEFYLSFVKSCYNVNDWPVSWDIM